MDDDEMAKLIERQGEVQEKLDHADAWDLDSRLEMAMDAFAARRRIRSSRISRAVKNAASRSAACCCKSPTFCLLDEPTNHLDAETVAVARAASAKVRGHDHRGHTRPLFS